MKALVLALAVTCVAVAAQAQVVPTTPTKFVKRGLGATNTTGGTISANGTNNATVGATTPKPQTIVRTVTYISLSPARQWTSTDGKPLLAKLIAFEDTTTNEVRTSNIPAPPAPATGPSMPKLSTKPTVVKEGKIRLLVGQQAVEVAMDRLSPLDRDYVDTIKHGIAASK